MRRRSSPDAVARSAARVSCVAGRTARSRASSSAREPPRASIRALTSSGSSVPASP